PAWAALLLALALVSRLISISTAPVGQITTTWSPAVGLGIAVLAMSPGRWWPVLAAAIGGITLTAGIVNDSAPWPYLTLFTVLSMVQSAAGAGVLRAGRTAAEVRLRSQEDAARI